MTTKYDIGVNLLDPFSEMPSGRPVQMIIRGRGRVGKTVLASAIGQRFRARGAQVENWCLDARDQPGGLGEFIPDARFPVNLQPIDCRRWLEAMFQRQKAEGFDVILDVGTGQDAVVGKLRHDSELVKTMAEDGIRTISVFIVGTESGDLDPVRRYFDEPWSIGEPAVIVFNQGIVGHGTLRQAFDGVRNDPAIGLAAARGAVMVEMPELGCMREVIERKLTFQAVVDDRRQSRVENPLSFFDQERVAIWWERHLPACLRAIPASWLPRLPLEGFAA